MLTLLGGPAAGAYAVKRAPLFLRAVVGRDGHRDVLDQLDDKPQRDERVYVYRLASQPSTIHLNMGGTRKGSGFYASASYLPYDVDGAKLRDNAAWRSWATAERDRILGKLERLMTDD